MRLVAAAVWLAMVWDMFDRIAADHPASSIIASLGLVTFVTLAILLPIVFGKSRPRAHTPRRWAWDAVVIASALFALGGLLFRSFGQ